MTERRRSKIEASSSGVLHDTVHLSRLPPFRRSKRPVMSSRSGKICEAVAHEKRRLSHRHMPMSSEKELRVVRSCRQ